MKEKLLHFIWGQMRFEHSNLRLFDGRELIIKSHGQFNSCENGPDFIDARVIIDSIEWIGNIEIHVRASDWYKHKHQHDANYNNVILHVVWENDFDVKIFNEVIPVLELKNRVYTSILANYESLQKQKNMIPCEKFIFSIEDVFKQQMIDNALIKRLMRKSLSYDTDDIPQSLYTQLARTVGGKSNQDSFEFIADKLPFSFVNHMKYQFRELTFNTLKESIQNQKNTSIPVAPMFRTKGMRPPGRHENRLKQFVQVIPIVNDFEQLIGMPARELVYLFRRKIVQLDHTITFNTQNIILINVVVPYLFSLGKDEIQYRERAVEILHMLPAEKNAIVQKMLNLGFYVKNSYQSQAVLEIYSQFCLKKQCLHCTIGSKIINS